MQLKMCKNIYDLSLVGAAKFAQEFAGRNKMKVVYVQGKVKT